jgi:putative DNA primase/helicase
MEIIQETPVSVQSGRDTQASAPSVRRVDRQAQIDFQAIAELALQHFDTVVEDILGLNGEHRGREFVAVNPKRDDYELGSFSINVESGKYADFAIQEECSGGDLISLASYIWDCRPIEAAKRLLAELEAKRTELPVLDIVQAARSQNRPKPRSPFELMAPIPEGSPELDPKHFVRRGETLERRYDYMDMAGNLCFVQLRLRNVEGGKTFMTVRVDKRDDGSLFWTGGMPDGLRPLFGLSALAGASDDQQVFVVEGEKAALALGGMMPSVPVVTSAGGASAPSKTDWSPLAGRNVVIWRDNDEPGLKYQERVIELICAANPTARINVIEAEPLFRALCPMMGWGYAEKAEELKGWDAADVAALGLDHSVIAEAVAAATREVSVHGTSRERTLIDQASGR